jgi:membrane-associated phospholipid phosphatase
MSQTLPRTSHRFAGRWFGRPKLPPRVVLLESALVALALSAFVLVGRLYDLPALAAVDAGGLHIAAAVRSTWLDHVATTVTSLGSEWLWPVSLVMVLTLVWLRRLPSAIALLVVVAGVQPLNDLLKTIYHRARPTEFGSGAQAFSFPSGHAMAAGAVYGLLAVIAWRELRGRSRWLAVGVCVGLAVAIALTRPYLGVHYPTDVAAGLLAGGVWADVVLLVWRALSTRRPRWWSRNRRSQSAS